MEMATVIGLKISSGPSLGDKLSRVLGYHDKTDRKCIL